MVSHARKANATMDESMVTLNLELIQLASTRNGGFTRAQLEVFGIPWPPPRGWKRGLVGQLVARAEFDEFSMKASTVEDLAGREGR